MLIILSNPTDSEIQFVEDILKIKGINNHVPKENLTEEPKPTEYENQLLLSHIQFEAELTKRGYRAATSKTRKKIADKYGIQYELKGRELWFVNQVDKIPFRNR